MRREGLVELPVGVHAARAARSRRAGGRGGRRADAHRAGELAGLVDVDPQPARVRDRVLVAARLVADGGGDEHLLVTVGVPAGEREQAAQPLGLAGAAAGQEVVAPLARGDPQVAVAARAGGELDEPVARRVQHPELQRAVALGRQRAGEQAPVGEPYPAAQRVRGGGSGARRARARGGDGRRHACCSFHWPGTGSSPSGLQDDAHEPPRPEGRGGASGRGPDARPRVAARSSRGRQVAHRQA